MNNLPFFSVIIPTYNRSGYVTSALESVLRQESVDFEIIVVDDGSNDDTGEKIKRLGDPRIRYFFIPNSERGAARNYGTAKSRGEYITFLDSDDLVYPGHLAEASRMISGHSRPEWFHLGYEVKSGEKVLWKENRRNGNLNNKLAKGNFLSCMGVFLRSDIAHEYGFDENRCLSGSEDWQLWMRLAARYPLKYSNTVTGCIRFHAGRSVLQDRPDQLIERTEYAYKSLMNDPSVSEYFNFSDGKILTYLNLYVALHLALSAHRRKAVRYIWRCLREYPRVIFEKRWYVAILKLFFRKDL